MSPVRPLPPENGREPRRVGENLEALARRLGAPGAASLSKVFTQWSELVGGQIEQHSRPLSLVDGVLVVAVDEPGWATELRFLSATLIERINARCGPGTVGRIDVRVRPNPAK
jgi:predicted nucleic acid-binding Zn ribbon protein